MSSNGGSSTTNTQQQQQQTQTNSPYAAAQPQINSLLASLGQLPTGPNTGQLGAASALQNLGSAGNQYLPGISSATNTLLGGGGPDRTGLLGNAYNNYVQQLSGLTNPNSLNPYNTPGFSNALQTLNSDITNQINQQFAGAGRDLSGMNTQTLARGLSQGEGALLANQYNQNVQNLMNAGSGLFGAGAQTAGGLSALDQTKLANMQAGIGAAGEANNAAMWGPLLQLQAAGIPTDIAMQYLQAQEGGLLPIASAFGTQTGTGSTTGNSDTQNKLGPLQQLALISSSIGNLGKLMPKPPIG